MNLRKNLFWALSRSSRFLYARFPVFGRLKASLGIIQKDGAFLTIARNDGLGLSFPGGLTLPWESAERALVREVLEETGLRVTRSTLEFCYDCTVDVPVRVTVFDVEVEGQTRGSWEGTPEWQDLPELRRRIIPGQRQVVAMLEQKRAGKT